MCLLFVADLFGIMSQLEVQQMNQSTSVLLVLAQSNVKCCHLGTILSKMSKEKRGAGPTKKCLKKWHLPFLHPLGKGQGAGDNFQVGEIRQNTWRGG